MKMIFEAPLVIFPGNIYKEHFDEIKIDLIPRITFISKIDGSDDVAPLLSSMGVVCDSHQF